MNNSHSRRGFLQGAGLGIGVMLTGCSDREHVESKKSEKENDDVTPGEDLMREHGVLKRVLLVYEESIRRLNAQEDLPPEALLGGANIIRSFIEDYHEKLEEEQLFPRLRKAGKLVEIVDILQQQHNAGRKLTEGTLRLANRQAFKNPEERRQLVDGLQQFIRMYNPHEAREDTVVFPVFRTIVSKHEYDALGEDFEKIEHQKLGADGFEGMVNRIEEIEKKLGIYDLAQFTPRV